MKKQLLLLLTTILTINSYSQISFEKGYFINNSDQKIDCLIKNVDWRNNPTRFNYKLSENSEIKNTNIKNVKEFGVYNISKYIRKTVKIDKSSIRTNELSNNKAPVFVEEQLFLKVLNDGKATLYLYKDLGLIKFFYNKENSNIEQLVFKKYETSDNKIGVNNYYKQQLWTGLKCQTITMNKIENIEYKKNSLSNLFTEYNKCSNSDYISYEKKQKKDLFNLTIRPRLNFSSLTVPFSFNYFNDINLDNKIGFGFGVEAEFILPFNKNKWAFTIEPTYQSYNSKKIVDVTIVSGGKLNTTVDYSSIEIPIGMRHYFFLNNDSKIFINAYYVFDFTLNSSIEFKREDNSIFSSYDEPESQNNFAFGAGYKLKDKYSLEIRYLTSREIIGNYSNQSSSYRTLSVIFGYSLF